QRVDHWADRRGRHRGDRKTKTMTRTVTSVVLETRDGPRQPLALPPIVRRLDTVIEVLLVALLLYLVAAYGTDYVWAEMWGMWLAAALAGCLAARIVIHPPRIAPIPA